MLLFDSHIHTICSHDGRLTASEQAEAAIARGLHGICITDHFDSAFYDSDYDCKHISESIVAAVNAAEKYRNKIDVTSGIELGDFIFGKQIAKKCLEKFEFDLVLCSVHSQCVGKSIFEDFKGLSSFREMTPAEDIIFLKAYFNCVLETLTHEENDYDVVAHLTYPVRYITAVNKRTVDMSMFSEQTDKILLELIKKEKALEVNTSCLGTDWKVTLPDFDILHRYYNLGGRLITLGSDAHLTDRLGIGFEYVCQKLKDIGFKSYYTYKRRTPVEINLH